jgi:alpha-L-fucosidase 2
MGIKGALKYEARLHAVTNGGTIEMQNGIDLIIKNADTVTLYFIAATNFVNYKDVSANAHERLTAIWAKMKPKTFSQIETAALGDYQKLFSRVGFHLNNTQNSYLATNERLVNIQSSPDPSLAALCYQFARYLMISCSRPGSEPANLQGIWNQDANPMWDAKYTTNINLQMNYWPVEGFNLPECVEPLTRFVKDITDDGAKVAKEHYNSRGWMFHQNSDLWRVAAPMDGPTWGTFTTAGAWLTNMLYEHYLYTMDTAYLRSIYPVIKGSAQFFMDFLVQHPNGKWLVTNPSTSPENFPLRQGNGSYFDEVTGSMLPGTTICAGSSIDMQILYDLFTFYSCAAKNLGTDAAFADAAIRTRDKLVPPQIGKDGLLQEWADDWGQLEDKHRHLSPLYGLYPGNELWVKSTPALTDACKKVLEERGDGANGFSRAWKMCLWARLGDGNRSYSIFKGYLKDQCYPQLFAKGGSALQVDATFGVAAGINEMLLQSQKGYMDVLPALPTAWADGEINGIMARGGFQIKLQWKNGKMSQMQILSKAGGLCRLKVAGLTKINVLDSGLTIDIKYDTGGIAQFNTNKNGVYTITAEYK